jgi:hypothetical protein
MSRTSIFTDACHEKHVYPFHATNLHAHFPGIILTETAIVEIGYQVEGEMGGTYERREE